MQIMVRLFAGARDAVGHAALAIEMPEGTTVTQAVQLLVDKYPALNRIAKVSRAAVNRDYAPDDQVLHDHDELAILPPVSGGA